MTFHFITHFYGTPITGGEKYNFRLVQALQNTGNKVIIHTDRAIPRKFKINYIFYNIWYIFKCLQFQNSILLIDHYMHPRTFLFVLFLRALTNVKIIGTVHHLYHPLQSSRLLSAIDRVIEGLFIASLHVMIIPSKYTLTHIRQSVFRMPTYKIIHPGVAFQPHRLNIPRRLFKKGQPIRLLFVGGIQKRKGLVFLIEALCLVQYKNLHLTIIGDPEKEPAYTRQLQNMIKNDKLNNIITLTGHISQEKLEHHYRQADIYVMPSLHEGYGIVVMEAMRFALPVIATDNASLPELVHNGVNGKLVPPSDPDSLAEAIDTLCRSPEKRKEMGLRSFELYQNRARSWEDVDTSFIELIKEYLG